MSKKWKYPTNDEFERYWEENIEMFKKRDISYMGKEWRYPMTVSKKYVETVLSDGANDISYMGKEWNEEFERLSQKAAERRDRELRERYIKEVTEANHAVEANEEIDQFVGLWEIAGLEYDVSWKHKNAKGKYVPRKYIARPTGDYGVIREYVNEELLTYGRKKTMADFEGLSWKDISDKAKEFIRSKIPDIDLKMTENFQNPVEPPEEWVAGKDASLTIEPAPEECPHPEWLGVWDEMGRGIRVTWEGPVRLWLREVIESGFQLCGRWFGPDTSWIQIEPAPLESRAHTKPKQKLSIGWDPYDLG